MNTLSKNQCSTCTLKHENDNIIVISGYTIATPILIDTQSISSEEDEAKKTEFAETDNSYFSELTNNSNAAMRNDDNTVVSMPTTMFDALMSIVKQYEELKTEITALKQKVFEQDNNRNESKANEPIGDKITEKPKQTSNPINDNAMNRISIEKNNLSNARVTPNSGGKKTTTTTFQFQLQLVTNRPAVRPPSLNSKEIEKCLQLW